MIRNGITTIEYQPGYHYINSLKSLWQYDYGQTLRLKGFNLPLVAEIHFSDAETGGTTTTEVGTTQGDITDVHIPDKLLKLNKKQDYNIYAFVYITDDESGNTECKIRIPVRSRPNPGVETGEGEKTPFADAINAVNSAADRAETAKKAVDQQVSNFDTHVEEKKAEASESISSAANTAKEEGIAAIQDKTSEGVKALETASQTGVSNITAAVEEGKKNFVTDDTLAIPGRAADSKVTGDKIDKLKKDLGEKGTTLTDIQKKISDSNSNDGFLLCDLNGNIVGHIASFEVWNNEPYNKKYGWGGHPYGNGKLPPYSKIVGILEADLLSVRGGKGRWNKDDTGNFQHGGHLFEGWNAEEDARLTFGIGTKNKDISWIQTFHAANQEGTDSGAYYCVTKVGSDIDNQGVNFMPSITQSRSLFSLKVGNNLSPNSKHIQKLVETGELVDWEYNKTDMIPYGTMYFDYTKDKVRVYTRTGGWKYLKFEEEV